MNNNENYLINEEDKEEVGKRIKEKLLAEGIEEPQKKHTKKCFTKLCKFYNPKYYNNCEALEVTYTNEKKPCKFFKPFSIDPTLK